MVKVSVIIATYNRFNCLIEAIDSVMRQTMQDFEIIVVNDRSKQEHYYCCDFKSKYGDKLRVIHLDKNSSSMFGHASAGYVRTVGMREAKGEYIAFLDSDDIWVKNKLEVQLKFMEKNNQVLSHTSYFVINKKNKIISSRSAKKIITFEDLLKSCDIGLSTAIVNTKFIKKKKYYFPKIKTKEDFVLWLKIAKEIKSIVGIDKKLTYYRKTENSLSSNKLIGLLNGYKVYRNYMNYSQIKSFVYLIILSINYFKKNILSKRFF